MTRSNASQRATTDASPSDVYPGSTLRERVATAAPVTHPVRQSDGSWILAVSLYPLDDSHPPRLRSRSTLFSRLRVRIRRSLLS